MTRRTAIARAALAPLLFLLLGGPAPGAVGSCSGDDDQAGAADFEAYCQEREQLVCVRRQRRGEISLAASYECRRQALELCARREFAQGCEPTEREANACLNALHSVSTLDRTVDQLEECRELCSLPANAAGDDSPRSLGGRDAGVAADGGMDDA